MKSEKNLKQDHIPGPSGIKSKQRLRSKKGFKTSAKNKKALNSSSSEDSSIDLQVSSEDDVSDVEDTDCVECGEHYYSTKSKDDWIQCIICSKWLHESCTMYPDMCNKCGRQRKRAENRK